MSNSASKKEIRKLNRVLKGTSSSPKNGGQLGKGDPHENGGQLGKGDPHENGGQLIQGDPHENGGQLIQGDPHENGGQLGKGDPRENGGQLGEGEPRENGGQLGEGDPHKNGGQLRNSHGDNNSPGKNSNFYKKKLLKNDLNKESQKSSSGCCSLEGDNIRSKQDSQYHKKNDCTNKKGDKIVCMACAQVRATEEVCNVLGTVRLKNSTLLLYDYSIDPESAVNKWSFKICTNCRQINPHKEEEQKCKCDVNMQLPITPYHHMNFRKNIRVIKKRKLQQKFPDQSDLYYEELKTFLIIVPQTGQGESNNARIAGGKKNLPKDVVKWIYENENEKCSTHLGTVSYLINYKLNQEELADITPVNCICHIAAVGFAYYIQMGWLLVPDPNDYLRAVFLYIDLKISYREIEQAQKRCDEAKSKLYDSVKYTMTSNLIFTEKINKLLKLFSTNLNLSTLDLCTTINEKLIEIKTNFIKDMETMMKTENINSLSDAHEMILSPTPSPCSIKFMDLINRCYRTMSLILHPDKNIDKCEEDVEKMSQLFTELYNAFENIKSLVNKQQIDDNEESNIDDDEELNNNSLSLNNSWTQNSLVIHNTNSIKVLRNKDHLKWLLLDAKGDQNTTDALKELANEPQEIQTKILNNPVLYHKYLFEKTGEESIEGAKAFAFFENPDVQDLLYPKPSTYDITNNNNQITIHTKQVLEEVKKLENGQLAKQKKIECDKIVSKANENGENINIYNDIKEVERKKKSDKECQKKIIKLLSKIGKLHNHLNDNDRKKVRRLLLLPHFISSKMKDNNSNLIPVIPREEAIKQDAQCIYDLYNSLVKAISKIQENIIQKNIENIKPNFLKKCDDDISKKITHQTIEKSIFDSDPLSHNIEFELTKDEYNKYLKQGNSKLYDWKISLQKDQKEEYFVYKLVIWKNWKYISETNQKENKTNTIYEYNTFNINDININSTIIVIEGKSYNVSDQIKIKIAGENIYSSNSRFNSQGEISSKKGKAINRNHLSLQEVIKMLNARYNTKENKMKPFVAKIDNNTNTIIQILAGGENLSTKSVYNKIIKNNLDLVHLPTPYEVSQLPKLRNKKKNKHGNDNNNENICDPSNLFEINNELLKQLKKLKEDIEDEYEDEDEVDEVDEVDEDEDEDDNDSDSKLYDYIYNKVKDYCKLLKENQNNQNFARDIKINYEISHKIENNLFKNGSESERQFLRILKIELNTMNLVDIKNIINSEISITKKQGNDIFNKIKVSVNMSDKEINIIKEIVDSFKVEEFETEEDSYNVSKWKKNQKVEEFDAKESNKEKEKKESKKEKKGRGKKERSPRG